MLDEEKAYNHLAEGLKISEAARDAAVELESLSRFEEDVEGCVCLEPVSN
jgi:hypothetical protein